jgi:hypothetical protein
VRRLHWLVLLPALLTLPACESALRNAGKSAIDGGLTQARDFARINLQRDSVKRLLDSLAAYTGAAIANHLRPPVDTTLQLLLARGESALLRSEDSTIARLRGPLSQALDELISTKLELAGMKARYQADSLVLALGGRVSSDISPRLDRATANLIDTAAEKLAASLRGALLESLLLASDTIASRATSAVSRAATQAVDQTPLVQKLKRWAPIAIVIVLVVAIFWMVWLLRTSRRALDVVTAAIHERGDESLRREVKMKATQRKIEPYLHEFLEDRGYLPTAEANKK